MAISSWMSWEGSVDLVALSQPNLEEPDIIVHCSRMVHTPVGSAPAGMILLPDLDTPGPRLIGFVSTNPVVSAYFGPHLFAGTPFELAPALQGEIEHETYLPEKVRATMRVMDFVIELELSDLGELVAADRGSGRLPFLRSLPRGSGDNRSSVDQWARADFISASSEPEWGSTLCLVALWHICSVRFCHKNWVLAIEFSGQLRGFCVLSAIHETL
ncbi:MAG: hypothetical protein HC792_03915 [Acaryochloridaceae cyanobacterium CSU_5_19]|nr:hypothetical protein [Acaryochloridaceae cyanobacterium CSU_5_19]